MNFSKTIQLSPGISMNFLLFIRMRLALFLLIFGILMALVGVYVYSATPKRQLLAVFELASSRGLSGTDGRMPLISTRSFPNKVELSILNQCLAVAEADPYLARDLARRINFSVEFDVADISAVIPEDKIDIYNRIFDGVLEYIETANQIAFEHEKSTQQAALDGVELDISTLLKFDANGNLDTSPGAVLLLVELRKEKLEIKNALSSIWGGGEVIRVSGAAESPQRIIQLILGGVISVLVSLSFMAILQVWQASGKLIKS